MKDVLYSVVKPSRVTLARTVPRRRRRSRSQGGRWGLMSTVYVGLMDSGLWGVEFVLLEAYWSVPRVVEGRVRGCLV